MDRQSSNGTDNRGVQAFVALQILGAVLFVMITTTAFVAQRRGGSRHPTFFSFCFSWIVFCASYALLTFAGQQERPDHSMCTVHAALVYAAPPLAGSTTVSLVTHLLLNVHLALYKTAKKRGSLFVSIALVFTPWIIWISIVIGVLFFGFHYPDLVQFSSNRTYCILINTSLPNLLSSWTTLFFVILIVEEIVIGVLLYRNRDLLRGYNQSATMTMRVMVLTIFAISGIAVAFVYTVTEKLGIQFDLLIGVTPCATAVIFGTQKVSTPRTGIASISYKSLLAKDLLQVWFFWKKSEDFPRTIENHTDILSTRLSSFSIPETESRGMSHAAQIVPARYLVSTRNATAF